MSFIGKDASASLLFVLLVSVTPGLLWSQNPPSVVPQAAVTLDALRLVKLDHSITSVGLQIDYTFDSEISQRLSELTCECARRQARGADVSPLAPKPQAGTTAATARVQIPDPDLVGTVALECTLSHAAPGAIKRTLITIGLDLSQRRELAEKATELTQTKTALARCLVDGKDAQKPTLKEIVEFPKRAVVRLVGSPCGRYQVSAKGEGEELKVSKPSVSGSTDHVLEIDQLTPEKTYDVEFWQLNAYDQAIESTREKKAGALKTPKPAGEVAFIDQHVTPVEGGLVIEAHTNVPAVAQAEAREYDVSTGIPGAVIVAAEPFSKDAYGRPQAADLKKNFRLPLSLIAGRIYQYRLVALNGEGIAATTEWQTAERTTAVFDFASPIEVAVTPIGFVVSWSASVAPDKATLTVDYGKNTISATKMSPPAEVSMALDAAATKEFLAAMVPPVNDAKSDAMPHVKPTLVVEMQKRVNTPSGQELRSVHREVRVALLQEKSETKAVLSGLSLTSEDKNKLIAVAEKTIEGWRGTKFNWSKVFSVALKLLVSGL